MASYEHVDFLLFTFHYASTLSEMADVVITLYQDLHSTMLLLYQLVWNIEFASPHIYIPLCFYFIRFHEFNFHLVKFHLHSTMLLLYLYQPSGNSRSIRNLHSTMLLLYLGKEGHGGWITPIYIPLCFYFIVAELALRSGITDLHSTMLLLYRARLPGIQ